MFNRHGLADAAGAILFQKAERRFEGLLAQHGVSNPSELPTALQEQILQRAIVETAAATFPTANIEMLKHGFRWQEVFPGFRRGNDADGDLRPSRTPPDVPSRHEHLAETFDNRR